MVFEENESFKSSIHSFDGNHILFDKNKEINKILIEEYHELIKNFKLKNSIEFYRELIGTVEIKRNKELSKIYFQKPFLSKYLTKNIKDDLIYKVNRNSNKERLEYMFYNVSRYKIEMIHRQNISKYSVIIIININFILILGITLLC